MLIRYIYITLIKVINIKIFNVTLVNLCIWLLTIIVLNTIIISDCQDFMPEILDEIDMEFVHQYSEYDNPFIGGHTSEDKGYEAYDIFIPKERIIYETTETTSTSISDTYHSDNSDTDTSSSSSSSDNEERVSSTINETSSNSNSDVKGKNPIKEPKVEIHPDVILKKFYTKIFDSTTESDTIKLSLDYVKQDIPPNMWARTIHEMNNPQHPIHKYMHYFSTTCSINTDIEKAAFLQYHAAVTTYNIMILSPEVLSDKDIQSLFFYNVDQVTTKYNIDFK